MQALDEVGLDKLSTRAVAARLGVQVGGLYYHLPDKSALLRLMANEICREALADFEAAAQTGSSAGTGRSWDAAALELCAAVRAAVRARRDAARVLAAGPLNGSVEALALMEHLIIELEHGISPALDELRARFPRVVLGAEGDDERSFRVATTAIIDGFLAQSARTRSTRRSR